MAFAAQVFCGDDEEAAVSAGHDDRYGKRQRITEVSGMIADGVDLGASTVGISYISYLPESVGQHIQSYLGGGDLSSLSLSSSTLRYDSLYALFKHHLRWDKAYSIERSLLIMRVFNKQVFSTVQAWTMVLASPMRLGDADIKNLRQLLMLTPPNLYVKISVGDPEECEVINYLRMLLGLSTSNAHAQYIMAGIQQFGILGVLPNPSEALRLYLCAAANGSSYAKYYLGCIYELGILAVERNHVTARYYYQAAADARFLLAEYLMSINYACGEVVGKVDFAKAAHYLKCAADQGYTEAQYEMAKYHHAGKFGFKRDNATILHYCQLAADQAHPEAQNMLAIAYQHGLYGLEQDFKKALWLYNMAGNGGNDEALFRLGRVYYYGYMNVRCNKEKGKRYMKRARDKGNAKAIDFLQRNGNL